MACIAKEKTDTHRQTLACLEILYVNRKTFFIIRSEKWAFFLLLQDICPKFATFTLYGISGHNGLVASKVVFPTIRLVQHLFAISGEVG